MMQKSKSQSSDLLRSMNFPTAGETLNGTKVISSDAELEGDILKYEVVLPKGTKTRQVPAILSRFFTTQVIPSENNLIVRHHDYTVKPKAGNVAVVGAMHVTSTVRSNPATVQEFDEEYSKMEMTNPETYFRKHECGPINSPQFRAKMFTLVSMMGENYGYGLKGCVYHRRASLIMPKIKITKAVPQAEMMYHTHPKKDEPSLSSPDDYLLYFDLSHNPRSIRHFYTVMKDRMDYFHITPKKNSKENFLKLSEDKIIDELDAEMTALEKKWDKKMPRNGNYDEDLRYCENITRDFVNFLNKKYGKYFTIKYKCYYKVKKNPPEPELEDLHSNVELLAKSLNSIRARDYTWTPEVKEKAHEDYAYWHHLRSLDTLAGSAKTLGISPQGSHKRTYNRYMNKAFEDTQYNYADALNILNLAHDISMADSKIRDAGGLTSRMKELCEYLEVSETGIETLQMLEEVIHNQNLFTEEAMTLTGDYYGLALLSSYAIQAVGAIEQVKEGKKEFSLVEYEIYVNLKSETQTRFQDFLVGELDSRGRAYGENAPIAQGFVDSFLNPPPVLLKKTEFEHQFPAQTFAYDYDLVSEALDKFNVEKYHPEKNFFTLGRFNLRIPTTFGQISMFITQRTGKAQIFVTGRPEPMKDALDAVTKVGTQLVRFGLPGIDPEEYDVQAIDVAQNPQTSQVIAIAGPSGSGKSTTIRNLLNLLPNSKTVPTVTTRKERKSDKKGERVFVSTDKFKKEMQQGNMIAAQLQKNGNYYGRRKSDFEGADYVIVDVNLKGINAIKRAYPNTFTIYLEPVEDPEFIRKRLLRRGDMSPQEAKGRASIIPAHIRDSKMIDFDARIKTKQGEFAKIALELEPLLPKPNPSHRRTRNPHIVKVLNNELGTVEYKATREQPILFGEQAKEAHRVGQEYRAIRKLAMKHDKGKEPYYVLSNGKKYFEDGSRTRGNPVVIVTTHFIIRLFTRDNRQVRLANEQRWMQQTKSTVSRMEQLSERFEQLMKETAESGHGAVPPTTPETDELFKDAMKLLREYNYLLQEPTLRNKIILDEEGPRVNALTTFYNPPREKPTLEEFRKWVELVNMKNKELQSFMKSNWFKVSGLTPAQAKAQGIKSGQDSFRAIIRMRKKLGLTGPKDYIKEGPQITKKYYELALKKWTGPDASVPVDDDLTDWGWMKRQIRFNSRASAFPYNKAQEKRKGPLVKKQKTQTQPSRKLLSLWVWGHDPWRWARKHGVTAMPKCPDVPWVGMTEKRKYGKIPVMMAPRSNPPTVIGTSNKGKMKEYKAQLGEGYTFDATYDLPEVEADPRTVIAHKAKLAYEVWGEPVLVEDTTLQIGDMSLVEASNVKWMLPRLDDYIGQKAIERISLGYSDGEKVYLYIGKVEGKMVKPRVKEAFAYDGHFLPDGSTKTYAEDKTINSRTIALQKMVADKPDHVKPIPPKWTGEWQAGYSPDDGIKTNPHHCPIEAEALRAASDPSFKHHEWYIEHHLNYVMAIAKAIVKSDEPEDQQLIHDMVWMHDYPKMMGDNDNYELVRELVSKHRSERYTDRLMNQLRWMEEIKSPDWSGGTTTIAAVMSTADALAHYYGPFFQIYHDENPDTPIEELKQKNAEKLEKDKRKLRAGPMKDGLDSVKFQYKGRNVRVVGNEHIAKLIERKNPRIPKKYEGQDPSEHSDLYTDEDPKGTIKGLGFKDKATAEKSVNIIKRSGKTHAHKIQAAMAMEQRARFHPNATPGIKAAQKVYAKFIEEMKEKTKRNPKKTPEGRKIPKRYLKGLNKEEMIIAAKEIDKGYKYDIDDPKAYEYWKSDIKATARGYKTVPSKYKKKFIEMYGPLPEKGEFLDKMAKATKIKKSILQKVYDKGLAAWRGGHRPGVQQHQWAAGRVYSFVTLGNTVKKGNKKMPDHSLAVEAGLIKENPPLYVHPDKAEKWSERYEKITAMTGQELLDLANKMAEEKGLKVELETYKMDKEKKQRGRRDFPLPPKYEKLYQQFLESKTGVDISLYRGNTLVDRLGFSLIEESTKELFEYLKQRKRLPPKKAHLPYVCRVDTMDGKRYLNFSVFFVTAATQPKNRFPIAIGGRGGFETSPAQQGKGYYGIIKTYQAGFLEANNIEAFGEGISPMRVDMYQSYGWLSAYSYKDNYPYSSRAAEYYLNLHGTTKRPNKDADYFSVYRPVYSRKMTGAAYRAGVKKMLETIGNPSEADFFPGNKNVAPYYMTAQTIPITALQNGGEWRHGEFAEDDPFEEYF